MIETICYNRRRITSIYSYQVQQKLSRCYEISLDQRLRNTRETGTLIHTSQTVTWFTCFGCCHHHLCFEFVFVFVISNVTWSSINKISLKQSWITCKVNMLIIWLAEETMWRYCRAWEKEKSFTNRYWQDSYKTINKQEIYKVNKPCTLQEQTKWLP